MKSISPQLARQHAWTLVEGSECAREMLTWITQTTPGSWMPAELLSRKTTWFSSHVVSGGKEETLTAAKALKQRWRSDRRRSQSVWKRQESRLIKASPLFFSVVIPSLWLPQASLNCGSHNIAFNEPSLGVLWLLTLLAVCMGLQSTAANLGLCSTTALNRKNVSIQPGC